MGTSVIEVSQKLLKIIYRETIHFINKVGLAFGPTGSIRFWARIFIKMDTFRLNVSILYEKAKCLNYKHFMKLFNSLKS